MKKTIIYYAKGYLLKALKKAKLPYTYHTLIKYEKNGIINRPSAVVSGRKDRYYTMEDINEIIRQIKEYKKI